MDTNDVIHDDGVYSQKHGEACFTISDMNIPV